MKLTAIFLLVATLQVVARTEAQNVTFSVKNAPIKEVFRKIQKQTGFNVLINEKVLEKIGKVTLEVHNLSVSEVLNLCFRNEQLSFTIVDGTIVVNPTQPIAAHSIDSVKVEMPPPLEISGRVTNEKGDPLIGVSVILLGVKPIGTITDSLGRFTIQADKGATILFSFVGYEDKKITITSKNSANSIQLVSNTPSLDDIVVIGYGKQKKISVTGAVSSIVTKDIKQSPSPNLVGALTGRLPGLVTVQGSGQPGTEAFSIYLRGASTTNGQNPLILIDGVPRDNITVIDPNEIASVSILKDASSTAVFGVRGANGVILITTKRGTTEKPQLNFTTDFSLQDFTKTFHSVDSWDYAILRNLARANDGLTPQFSQESIDKYKSGVDRFLYPNTNWFELLTKKNAPLLRYNMNVSGGNDRLKYFMNVGYTHQGGMFNTEPKSKLGYDPQFKMDRYNFRTNLDLTISSWVKSSLNLAGYVEKVNAPSSSNNSGTPFYIVLGFYGISPASIGPLTRPGYGVPADELVIAPIGNEIPSFGQLNRSGVRNTDRSNLNSSLTFDFDLSKITKGLSSKVMASFDYLTSGLTNAFIDYNGYTYNITQVPNPSTGQLKDSVVFFPKWTPTFNTIKLSRAGTFSYKMNTQWTINYARTFGNKHQVSGLILAQRDNYEVASGSSDLLLPYNYLGVSARATYEYDNRYLMEFNAGYNGSEQFQQDRRFGFFPAGSIGWIVSNEKFMKAQKLISKLKLRASYGKVGNDQLGNNRFLYLDNVAAVNGGFSQSLGLGRSINENLIGNPLITWETAYKQNFGLEVTFFKELSFTGDLFFEHRKNILITRGTVPAIQGLPLSVLPKANIGDISNRGYELELVYKKTINKDFSFSISGNYNYNKNTVNDVDESPFDSTYAYRYRAKGFSLGQNFGYLIDWGSKGKGYFTSTDEIISSGLTYSGVQPKPGDFVYKDLNGDKIIDSKDQAPIKYGFIPRVTYGAQFSLNYKGFDISVLVQGVAQTSQYYDSWGMMEGTVGNYLPLHLNSWTKARFDAGETITYPRLTSLGASASKQANDFFILDRSYTRLKNAEIGYSFSQRFLKRYGIQKMRIYCNGQNLFVWDKLGSSISFDPEQSSATALPIMRVFNFGLNIVF